MDKTPPPDLSDWFGEDDNSSSPSWDQAAADALLGRYALVGITYMNPDDTVQSHAQYHGRIVSVDRKDGIKIACEGVWEGRTMSLPPVLDAFQPAELPKYRLNSTGEVVTEADVLTTWTVGSVQVS